MITTHKSYCRFCHAACALEVDIEDGKPVAVRGDPSDPVYGGYSCIKGRQLPAQFSHPKRVRRALKRQAGGAFSAIPTPQAVDEIADRVLTLIDRHGPRSVATYLGSYGFYNSVTPAVSRAWHKSVDSPSYYTSVTIDQSAKFVARSRFGSWGGGSHGFTGSDVCMLFGNNPLVSHFSVFGGVPPFSPAKRLRDEMKKGLQMIVVDPRRTEIAGRGSMHLQIRPGEDATLLCGLIGVILGESLHDRAFCDQHVRGLGALEQQLQPFTPSLVAERCGLPAGQIVEAARMFAGAGRGVAVSGTGPDFAPDAVLTEHLLLVLNTICGRYNREGEQYPNPGILLPGRDPRAEVLPPRPVYGGGAPARVRGLAQMYGEMPTATLADEILLDGEGRIRALICLGGNPVVAFPDQDKTVAAMQKLDLLVCLDVFQTATTRFADFVLPPVLSFSRDDITLLTDSWYEEPYCNFARALLPREPESMEEWELYWEISRRSGVPIRLPGGILATDNRPGKLELFEKVAPRSRVPIADLADRARGHSYRECEIRVAAGDAGNELRFDLLPENVADQINALATANRYRDGLVIDNDRSYAFLLTSRRMKQVFNSTGRQYAALMARGNTNPAGFNPRDMQRLGIKADDLVEIEAAAGTVVAVAEQDRTIKPGVVSMAHAWGEAPDKLVDVRSQGASTNRLVDDDRTYDPITGQPRMSAIPVNVRRLQAH